LHIDNTEFPFMRQGDGRKSFGYGFQDLETRIEFGMKRTLTDTCY